jgi:hypothetical protein
MHDQLTPHRRLLAWGRSLFALAVVAVLLVLGLANIAMRAQWHQVEDGVLWQARPEGVTATEVSAQSPAAAAGITRGDVLTAVNGSRVERPADLTAIERTSAAGTRLSYTIDRLGAEQVFDVTLAPYPRSNPMYFVLAAVGLFTLLVGASVRLRRPEDQATLHFFWLCVAFFGVFTFSFNGPFDRLDWVFYWGDAVAMVLLPPLLLDFTAEFPERPARSRSGWSRFVPLAYIPAALMGRSRGGPGNSQGAVSSPARGRGFVYLAVSLVGGLAIMIRALKRGCSVTARRQLRWIVWGTALGAIPFVLGYVLPFTLGFTPSSPFEFTAVLLGLVPLAFASAIIRYRLMDVEVIIKRALVSAAGIAAIAAIYAILLRVAGRFFLHGQDQQNPIIALLATIVVVLLSSPLKNAIQLRSIAYYRDRYVTPCPRRIRPRSAAISIFCDSVNGSCGADRTLVVDRMALLLARAADRTAFVTIAQQVRSGAADARARVGHRAPPDGRPYAHARRSTLATPTGRA